MTIFLGFLESVRPPRLWVLAHSLYSPIQNCITLGECDTNRKSHKKTQDDVIVFILYLLGIVVVFAHISLAGEFSSFLNF